MATNSRHLNAAQMLWDVKTYATMSSQKFPIYDFGLSRYFKRFCQWLALLSGIGPFFLLLLHVSTTKCKYSLSVSGGMLSKFLVKVNEKCYGLFFL